MRVAIHQPHYFPWLGYLHKMAMVDEFVLMDTVQLEKGSYMYRNRIVDEKGEIRYLTISADKHGFLDREYRDIITKDNEVWIAKQKAQLKSIYSNSEWFDEVWHHISLFFMSEHKTLCETTIESIGLLRKLFEIPTKIVLQSSIVLPSDVKKNDLVLEICKAEKANTYYSGNGAKGYMDIDSFEQNNIDVQFQEFVHPIYKQNHKNEFIPGLSSLDVLFCCGIQKSKELFWETVAKGNK